VSETEPELTAAVTAMLLPCPSLTEALQLPAFAGVTTIVKLVPEPLGVPKVAMAEPPVPQVPAPTAKLVVETVSVTVIVWA
jgi:hypothetical protein